MSELNESNCFGCNVATTLLGAIESDRLESEEERAGVLTDGQHAAYVKYYDVRADGTGLSTPDSIGGFTNGTEYADAMTQYDKDICDSRDARNVDREARANSLILGCPRLPDRRVQIREGCRAISLCPGVSKLIEIQDEFGVTI